MAESARRGRRATPVTAGALVGIRGANRSYYLFDGLGSVVAVTSASGSVTHSYTYDPYGVTTETKATLTNVVNPWRYAGQYFDGATAMYKMGARYYQPELGRWTQQDPSGLDANAYAYVGGNPANFVDPSGLNPFSWLLDAINLGKAIQDLVDRDSRARDLLDDLLAAATTAAFATACAYFVGTLALPTGFLAPLAAGGICAVLSTAAGALVGAAVGEGE